MIAASLLIERQRERHPDLRALHREIDRHDADDRARDAVENNRLAHDVRIAGKALLPEAVAEDGDRRAAGLVLVLGDPAADDRRQLEHAKQARRHARCTDALRVPLARQDAAAGRRAADGVEDGVLIAPVDVLGKRRRARGTERLRVVDRDERVGIGEWQRFDQHRVHDAEHRRVGADAERQRDHGQRREPRIAREQPKGETDVLKERFHGSPQARRA